MKVDLFDTRQTEAAIQCCLVRLGHDIGEIDGRVGPRTKDALAQEGVPADDLGLALELIEAKVQARFPEEYGLP